MARKKSEHTKTLRATFDIECHNPNCLKKEISFKALIGKDRVLHVAATCCKAASVLKQSVESESRKDAQKPKKSK